VNQQSEPATAAAATRMSLSEDGYVRLGLAAFILIPLSHLLSGLDEDSATAGGAGASLAVISGYTEWVSGTTPVMSIGWDWRLDASQGQPCCIRQSEPSSNIMLVDPQGRDLGPTRTAFLLGRTVDTMAWQAQALRAINARYS
jgi:hypothetical protein